MNILKYLSEYPPMAREDCFSVCCVQVEMLYRTNLVALVSGGRKPKFAENTVMIYDDNSGKMVSGGWRREGHVRNFVVNSIGCARCWSSRARTRCWRCG